MSKNEKQLKVGTIERYEKINWGVDILRERASDHAYIIAKSISGMQAEFHSFVVESPHSLAPMSEMVSILEIEIPFRSFISSSWLSARRGNLCVRKRSVPTKFETCRLQEIPFSKELTDNYCALGLLFESIICNNNNNLRWPVCQK